MLIFPDIFLHYIVWKFSVSAGQKKTTKQKNPKQTGRQKDVINLPHLPPSTTIWSHTSGHGSKTAPTTGLCALCSYIDFNISSPSFHTPSLPRSFSANTQVGKQVVTFKRDALSLFFGKCAKKQKVLKSKWNTTLCFSKYCIHRGKTHTHRPPLLHLWVRWEIRMLPGQ